jgi:hypothetical protein
MRKIFFTVLTTFITVAFWIVALSTPENDRNGISVAEFSSLKASRPLPETWKPMTFKDIEKHTRYSLVNDGGTTVVMAEAASSASGLIREIEVDPREYPVIQWHWKVTNVLEKGNVHQKTGDDYPARLYVTFKLDIDGLGFFEKLKYRAVKLVYGRYPPYKAINYIWANQAPKGTMVPNAYTGSAMMFAIESGRNKLNQWVQEMRNVHEDYKKAFGAEPPAISGVAIMTDTDNTKETAKAYYGDISFKRGKP